MSDEKIDKERLNRIFEGQCNSGDEQFLIKLFRDSTLKEELNSHLKRQWYEVSSQEPAPEKNLDHILYKLNYDINTTSRQAVSPVGRFLKISVRIAAAIIFIISIYTAIQFRTKSYDLSKTWTEIKAPAWTQANFILPDSTKVWLNSRSTIKYSGNYLSERSVVLDGEAYFDVHSDKAHPFTVEADALYIKALGTKFNVASYNDEQNMEIVLEEGELLINDKEFKRSVHVVPEELITFNKKKDEIVTEYVQTKSYVSWKEGKLVFRNDPIDVIARRLGRWYNVDVEIKGHDFDQLRLRATFVEENLEEVLWYLKQSLPIKYKIVEGGILANDDYSKKKVIITLL